MNQALDDYSLVLRRWWRVLVIAPLLAVTAAALYFVLTPDEYSAESKLFVSTPRDDEQSYYVGGDYSRKREETFLALGKSPEIAQRVVDDLGWDLDRYQVLARTQLSSVGNTVLLKLTTTGDTPEQAVALGYAYIEELRRSISALEAVSGGLVSRVDLVPVQPPSIQGHSGMFPTWMILGAAGALGLMAGAFTAVVVALLDGRIHRAEDAAEATATPVLATFGSSVRWEDSVLQPLDGESGRQLRGTFDRLAIVGSNVVMVASAEDGAGKTGIALIAARVLADRGSAVAFLDFDSRGSRLASALELEDQESVVARVGATVVDGRRPPRMQTIPRANWHGVTVIPFGTTDEDAGAIADHPGTGTTMEALRRTYDWVIVDTPAATDFSDASRLARHVDAVVLVAKANHSTFDELRVVSDQLRLAGGRLSGVVFVDNAQVDRRFNPNRKRLW